jgi:hypothetical protein
MTVTERAVSADWTASSTGMDPLAKRHGPAFLKGCCTVPRFAT